MSVEKVMAALEGYEGPIFPEEVDELNENYSTVRPQRKDLATICGCIKSSIVGYSTVGFFQKINVSTTDGYSWLWKEDFDVNGSEIVVLFPGTEDRSIAIYTRGQINPLEIKTLLLKLQISFLRLVVEKQIEEKKLQMRKIESTLRPTEHFL